MIADARAIILSRIIYNLLLMLLLSCINLFFYTLFIGNMVQDMSMFIVGLLLGSMGFASVMTMISAIASRAGSNTTLMAILSFPVLMPLLTTVIRFSKNAMDGLAVSQSYNLIIILVSLNILVVSMSYLLFPYLWRE